ncbi:hypothetical protein Tco_1114575 [Tanacetum coccineum]|uniref:Uncharacterized protein n=1 Tax=Tanacetum coccineum TaxID=301880 RepID=A0ABQ5IVI3_9ASTR
MERVSDVTTEVEQVIKWSHVLGVEGTACLSWIVGIWGEYQLTNKEKEMEMMMIYWDQMEYEQTPKYYSSDRHYKERLREQANGSEEWGKEMDGNGGYKRSSYKGFHGFGPKE